MKFKISAKCIIDDTKREVFSLCGLEISVLNHMIHNKSLTT